MAQQAEPMDIDISVCDFDNKENSFHHSNVLPRTPCTEKGYEELDVSELNMKLRYSITPASSPMSKSYTANSLDNRNYESENRLDYENGNMTRSLHSTLPKNDTPVKSQKTLPLQATSVVNVEIAESNRNVLRPLDSTITVDNVTVTISRPEDIDETISLPSSSSSMAHTPEATTPTKEMSKDLQLDNERSPIMRGLKSVLNMFRASQSPIPPTDEILKQEAISPPIVHSPQTSDSQMVSASTPVAGKTKDPLYKSKSPNRDSLVFNENLEKELEWKDDSTILFKHEKIPIHKLFYQNSKTSESIMSSDLTNFNEPLTSENLDGTVEYMDVSYNDSGTMNKTLSNITLEKNTKNDVVPTESDSEFVDCESSFNQLEQSFRSLTNESISTLASLGMSSNPKVPLGEETEDSNVSEETLNGSISKSVNLSGASIVTTVSSEIPPAEEKINKEPFTRQITSVPQNEKSHEDLTSKVTISTGATQAENLETTVVNELVTPTLDLNSIIDLNNTYVNDNVTNVNSAIDDNIANNINNNIVANSPTNELVVSCLSQIPLIADPRVLLFNLASVSEPNEVSEKIEKSEGLSSPADIPLPDDDDIEKNPSLPYINSALENLSHTLDKIAEEIPKINQEDVVPMVINLQDKPVDFNIENTTIPETKILNITETQEIYKTNNITNTNFPLNIENTIMPETDKLNITETQEIYKTNNVTDTNLPLNIENTTMPETEKLNITETQEIYKTNNITNTNLPLNIENTTMPETDKLNITETQEIYKTNNITNTNLPLNIENITMPETEKPNISETQEIYKTNNVTNTNLPTIIKPASPLVAGDDIYKPEEIFYNSKVVSDSKTPVSPSLAHENIFSQNYEPMDVSMVKVPDEDQTGIIAKIVAKRNACIIEAAVNSHDIKMEPKELKDVEGVIIADHNIDQTTLGVQPDNLSKTLTEENDYSPERMLSTQEFKPMNTLVEATLKIDSNFEILKQEVEAIVAEAVDISTEKSHVTDTEDFIDILKPAAKNAIENIGNMTPEKISVNTSDVTKTMFVETDLKIPELLQNDATESSKKEIESAKEVQAEDISLNAYVKENGCNITTGDDEEKITEVELQVQDDNKDALRADIQESFLSKMNSKLKIAMTEEQGSDVNAQDTQKTNKTEPADEEVIASKNSSPFVLVSADIEEAQIIKPNDDLEIEENSFEYISNVKMSPPSPKIVSKGYNFNFDEIEDPFATKTKIRATPPPAESPNHTLNQIGAEKEFSKRDASNKINRRKSQPEKRKPVSNNKRLNSTFAGKLDIKTKVSSANVEAPIRQSVADIIEVAASQSRQKDEPTSEPVVPLIIADTGKEMGNKNTTETKSADNSLDTARKYTEVMVQSQPSVDSITVIPNENIEISSLEQTINCLAGTSTIEDKSIDNLADIDNPDFKPFVTKTKRCESPVPEDKDINPFATRSKICKTPPLSTAIDDTFTENKIGNSAEISVVIAQETEIPTAVHLVTKEINPENQCEQKISISLEEKDCVENLSCAEEVNTEDEDTIEGPFLKAEDLDDDEKNSEFGGEHDMMQFSELVPGNQDGNNDADELFIDAEAFEFLLNQNQTNIVADSGKESLFLKFDPLFAKRVSSQGALAGINKVQTKQSTPKKFKSPIQRDATFDKSSVAGTSRLDVTQDIDINNTTEESYEDLNVTVSKPMMVVNPAVNPVVTPRNKSMTPVRTNRQSLTFTSPAIAVIDRLLSMSSANNSLMGHDTTVAEVQRDNEADLALTQLRELLADKEIAVYHLKSESKELKERLSNLELHMKNLEAVSEERLKKINQLNEKLNEKTQINKSMAKVVEEYERTIASLIAEKEQDKIRHAEERMQLIKERDEQTAHLSSMEVSFTDLHSKYEKSKQVLLALKANEDKCKKSFNEFEENLAKMQNNYEQLKQHATSKLNQANEELQKINRAHEAEVLKLNALIKRKELHVTSLEESLKQKTVVNEKLTAICDELINKVSG